MRHPQFSIRALLLLTVLASIAIPLAVFIYPHVKCDGFARDTKIAFPDLQQWQRDFDTATADRKERENRLIAGLDTVDDAMNRFVNHDFIGPEKFEGVSGWIMTTDSGARYRRATLQRQSSLFAAIGDAAVRDLLKWLNTNK